MEGLAMLFRLSSFLLSISIAVAVDNFTSIHFIKDSDTIVSAGGSFEMGLFSPGNSGNRYVGIWYKKISIKTVVWVANRESPLTGSTSRGAVLKVINPGTLVLLDATNNIIWSSNTSRSSAIRPVAQLLESGNLVVKEAYDDSPRNFYWQSFDYPCDTLLPGMKLGTDLAAGLERHLSSWKSYDDPAPGDFTYHCEPSGYLPLIVKRGSVQMYRTGPWNGTGFGGLRQDTIYTYKLVFNDEEAYYTYHLVNSSVVLRYMLSPYGTPQQWVWVNGTRDWVLYLSLPIDSCDMYALCGAYGSCNISNSPECGCLNKFVPKNPEDWARADWSKGCVRKTSLDCANGDGFLKYSDVKLPETQNSWSDETMNLKECAIECLNNCSCTAYANLDIRGGESGCLLWFGDLVDIKEFLGGGQDVYIRMASTELEQQQGTVPQLVSNGKKGKIIKVSLSLLFGMVLLGVGLTVYVWKKKKKKISHVKRRGIMGQDYTNQSQKEELELPLFGLSTLTNATNNFSINNKLGQGGFGPVYKGVLKEGQEIAVKRLSKTSRQGLHEFKNEVICIAKLQHRNLVKLLGCCIEGDEMMLIYEYMPNNSLDSFIFDEKKGTLLDWPKRFNIINGIAKGLLYLHQDSRLRIIHRDIKASNVLLDFDMNPKISDFGLARSFGGNETEANTNRVVGTYGYMSPEYAGDGLFSVKSDVFSFGVLVLEIVSGKRNRGFIHQEHQHNLLGHAWRLHKEDMSLELIDAPVRHSCQLSEVLRSVQVGLLCVQQCAEDRPSMSSVVLMLGGEGALPLPKQPGFFTERNILENECSPSMKAPSSNNEITITLLDGR